MARLGYPDLAQLELAFKLRVHIEPELKNCPWLTVTAESGYAPDFATETFRVRGWRAAIAAVKKWIVGQEQAEIGLGGPGGSVNTERVK